MSTEIATIQGRYELINRLKPIYRNAEIHVTRFWGGKNGPMIQITTQCDKTAYVQLTREQVQELAEILKNCFNEEIYPSD